MGAKYVIVDPTDPIEIRLEEYLSATNTTIHFERINRGFFRFGDGRRTVELDVIHFKVVARTEDGWNRGKFGPIKKFIEHYEGLLEADDDQGESSGLGRVTMLEARLPWGALARAPRRI